LTPAVAGRPVETAELGGFAAVVGRDVDPETFGVADDLLAHTRVLDAIAATTDVVPLAFGTIVPAPQAGDEEVELLRDAYTRAAEQVSGAVQCTLSVRYDEQRALAELVGADPRIARLRDETAGTGEYAARAQKLRLGQLVVEGLDAMAAQDGDRVLAALTPLVRDAVRRERRQADEMIEVAALVDRTGVEPLARAAEDLAGTFAGRARFRFLGPQAPYDFVGAA
jgi:hypothetical protein